MTSTRTRRTHRATTVRTLGAYLDLVDRITSTWRTRALWFRGSPRRRDSLVPSAYRPRARFDLAAEARLRAEFARKGAGVGHVGPAPANGWEWYQAMQHHGFPTRLLDWSEASLVGIYFAVRSIESGGDLGVPPASAGGTACVWVLDPRWLNSHALGRPAEPFDDARAAEIGPYLAADEAELPELPIAVASAHASARVRAQHGTFTVHGADRRGLERALASSRAPRLACLRVAKGVERRIEASLRLAGTCESVLFPDLDALARELRARDR